MTDILTSLEKRGGWWIEEKSSIPCGVSKSGLIVKFFLKDVEDILDDNYPSKQRRNETQWYFNDTFDREIAWQVKEFVYANPQILWRHFLQR